MASRETKISILIEARNKAEAAFASLDSNLKQASSSVEHLGSAMTKVGAVGAAAFAGLAAVTFGFVKAGAGFEQTQVAFETMLGSADEATQLLKELSDFAKTSPFELVEIREVARRMKAFGIETKKIIPTVRMFSDIAAGVGMDKLPQLTLAFGQVKAATKLTGAELRQFSEANVPLLEALANTLGKSEAQIMEMVSAGTIGFPQVEAALRSMTEEGGRFYNLGAVQATTLAGLWSQFKDQITQTAETIGIKLLPVLKPLVVQLISVAAWVQGFVKEHPKLTAALLIAATAFAGITAVLIPLGMALPGIILLFGGLSAALATFGVASLAAGATFVAMVALIAAAVASLWLVYENWEDLWGAFKVVVETVAYGIVGIFEWMGNFVIDVINGLIDQVNKLLKKLQSIPMIGDKFSGIKIEKLSRLDLTSSLDPLGSYNDLIDNGQQRSLGEMLTGAGEVPADQFYGPVQTPQAAGPRIELSNNVFLDENAAEKMGNLLMSRLKLSNPI